MPFPATKLRRRSLTPTPVTTPHKFNSSAGFASPRLSRDFPRFLSITSSFIDTVSLWLSRARCVGGRSQYFLLKSAEVSVGLSRSAISCNLYASELGNETKSSAGGASRGLNIPLGHESLSINLAVFIVVNYEGSTDEKIKTPTGLKATRPDEILSCDWELAINFMECLASTIAISRRKANPN